MNKQQLVENIFDFLNSLDTILGNIEQLQIYLLDSRPDIGPSDDVQELFTMMANLQDKVTSKWKEIEDELE